MLTYVSCSKIYGPQVGVALMKYFDFHYLFGHLLSIMIKYFLPGDNDYLQICKVFLLMHLVLVWFILLLPKPADDTTS